MSFAFGPPLLVASTRWKPLDVSVVKARMSRLLASGHPTADQPDGHGNEQHRQREQPAALDPLERPEVAGRLVVRPLRVAVLGETRRWAKGASYGYSAARSRNERRGAELLE